MLSPNLQARRAIDAWWSSLKQGRPLNPWTELEVATLLATIFFLPTQLGRHFWPDWALVQGLRSDYLSPTIYLTDILIGFLVLQLLWRAVLTWRRQGRLVLTLVPAQKIYAALLAGLLLAGLVSAIGAANRETAWWHLIKLAEFGLWGGVLGWFMTDRKILGWMVGSFLLGGILQALIALGQTASAHDLGLWILGERRYGSQTPGVAQAIINGQLILRPYGTLPHPNVLGFWLLVSGNIALWRAFREKGWLKIVLVSLTFLFAAALLVTLSRLAIALWVFATSSTVAALWPGGHRTYQIVAVKTVAIALAIVAMTALFVPILPRFASLVTVDTQTVGQRLELAQQALGFIREHPSTGVGLGNFVVVAAEKPSQDFVRFLQPAHNLYLLVAAEVGIIGLLFLLGLLSLAFLRAQRFGVWVLLVILVEVVVVGLFDHFFWTTQQGGLLLWSIIGGLFSPMVGRAVIPDRPLPPPS